MLTGRAFRDAVEARSGGRCECCGERLDWRWEAHHRLPGGAGGSHRQDRHCVSNGLALNASHHNMAPASVHVASIRARALGYLISQHDGRAIADIPVYLHGQRWVLLRADGLYVPTVRPDYADGFVA